MTEVKKSRTGLRSTIYIGILLYFVVFWLIRAIRNPPKIVIVNTLAIIVLLILTLIITASYFLMYAVRKSLNSETVFSTIVLEEIYNLDQPQFAWYTKQFEALGFEKVLDLSAIQNTGAPLTKVQKEAAPYSWRPSETPPQKKIQSVGYGRLFLNRELGCYGEINQAMSSKNIGIPANCTVASEFGGGWSYTTTDRNPICFIWLMRRPKSLFNCVPGKTLQELLAFHIEQRNKIMRDLGVQLKSDISMENYFANEKKEMLLRREIMRRKDRVAALFVILWHIIKPKYEWMGDREKIVQMKRDPWKYQGGF